MAIFGLKFWALSLKGWEGGRGRERSEFCDIFVEKGKVVKV